MKGNDMQKNGLILNERPETNLETHDFHYDLPEELIAQYPSEERDGCRLMVLNKERKTVEHKIFRDIIEYLRPEDTYVKILSFKDFYARENCEHLKIRIL